MKKQSFISGALILMIANAISKILGAVFKIPLTYILEEEGMAIFNTSFQIYIMILSFIVSGFPFAVAKLVAEKMSLGKKEESHSVVKISAVILSVLGIIGSIALYALSPFFAAAMKEENAVYAMRAVSPAVFFVALGTAYKSYFQGTSNMIPTAISQVAEAVIKLAAGYALAVFLINGGAAKCAGGAVMGVTAGEIIATAILMLLYFAKKREKTQNITRGNSGEIIKALMTVAIPLLCASVVGDMMNVLDTTVVRNQLLKAGLEADEARFLYGAYTGYALTVFNLPIGILSTLGISILPVIAGAIAVGNRSRAKKATQLALRLTILASVPCSVLLFTQSDGILELLFHNTSSAMMLTVVSPCVVMMCVSQICAAVLQSANKIAEPFFFALIGSVIKLIISFILVKNPHYNIYGSAIGSNIACLIIMILNLNAVKKHLDLKLSMSGMVIKPFLAAAVMCLVIYFLQAPLDAKTANDMIRLFVTCILSMSAYLMTLFLTNAVSIREVRKILK